MQRTSSTLLSAMQLLVDLDREVTMVWNNDFTLLWLFEIFSAFRYTGEVVRRYTMYRKLPWVDGNFVTSCPINLSRSAEIADILFFSVRVLRICIAKSISLPYWERASEICAHLCLTTVLPYLPTVHPPSYHGVACPSSGDFREKWVLPILLCTIIM